MDRTQKELLVEELKDKFSRAKAVVFTDYKGLDVSELTSLRIFLRQADIEYKVVKNTIAKIASQQTPVETAKDFFAGPVGVAIGYDDPTIAPKKILDFVKDNEKLQVVKGIIEGDLCDAKELKSIAQLPSREVLLSKLLSAMSAPMYNLAGVLNATVAKFGYVLNAVKDKKSE